jgi:hypothetical protein
VPPTAATAVGGGHGSTKQGYSKQAYCCFACGFTDSGRNFAQNKHQKLIPRLSILIFSNSVILSTYFQKLLRSNSIDPRIALLWWTNLAVFVEK